MQASLSARPGCRSPARTTPHHLLQQNTKRPITSRRTGDGK